MPEPDEIDQTRREFLELVEARSLAGGIEYGDRSFDVPGHLLAGEITEELADVSAWSIVLFHRVKRLAWLLEQLEPAEAFLRELKRRAGLVHAEELAGVRGARAAELVDWIDAELDELWSAKAPPAEPAPHEEGAAA